MQRHDEEEHPFTIRVSPDRLSVSLSCEGTSAEPEELCGQLLDELARLKVAKLPQRDEMVMLFASLQKSNIPLDDYVIIQGMPPEPPVDGRIEWTRDFFSTAFALDPQTNRVDYRTRVGNPAVAKDELIARVREPIPGTPGVDVFGKPIRVQKPRIARLRAGRNVREDAATREFFAASNGRVRLFQSTLAVDDVLELRESIGLKTGHIVHTGALRVHGDILAESRVSAEGDIDVDGMVEPCHVRCGGNLIVRGGISGSDGHAINAAAGVQARFLNQVELEAGEDVAVASEVRNCKVNTRGALNAPGAKIIGGVVCALGGIDILEAGSEGRIATRLVVAHDYRLEHEIHARTRKLQEIQADRNRIMGVLDSLLPHLDSLPQNKRDAAQALLENVRNIDAELRKVEDEITELRQESAGRAKPTIVVRGMIYPETLLQIEHARLRIHSKTPGPVRATVKDDEVVLAYATVETTEEPVRDHA